MFLSDLKDGASIFIDANIFVYHFSQESKYNLSCSNFLERVEKKKVSGFTSTLIIQEVTHRMMIVEAATSLSGIEIKSYVKYLRKHPDIAKKLVVHQLVPEKIASFNLEIISPDIHAIKRSQKMKNQYGFLSNDALTLQIMDDVKIYNLASNDSDFQNVDFIKFYRPSFSAPSSA